MYDTDGIYESQSETIRGCSKCGGAFKVNSKSDRGWKITAIHSPVNVCKECRDQAYAWFDENHGTDICYLNDNSLGKFEQK